MLKRFIFIFLILAACTPVAQPMPESDFQLTSPSFADGEVIPVRYAYSKGNQCSGDNISPPLAWTRVPSSTRAFALTVIDPDGNNWVHWLVFNIPGDTASFPESESGTYPGIQGTNSFGQPGWGGPCPPSGTHHYIFSLYALDAELQLSEGTSLKELQSAIEGHVLAQATLTGLYSAP